MNAPTSPTTVIHIPHASTVIPGELLNSFALYENSLAAEVLRMTDAYTDELFELDDDLARSLEFPVSRLVVDPERFVDDELEVMSQVGMGVIYTKTADGGDLRHPLSESQRKQLIDKYYWPHHRWFEDLVHRCLELHDYCLIIDAHSFPSAALPYELDQSPERPDICIGTDPDHTPTWLADKAESLATASGWSVKRDSPFSGAIVPTAFYRRGNRVLSIMIEVNRALYMDESSGEKNANFSSVENKLGELCRRLIEHVKQFVR
jgi:N-formylglutamate deformylase